MTDKEGTINGVECIIGFKPNPADYRRCSLRGKDDNCDKINDCFIKQLLEKLQAKEQECETLVCQLDFEVQKKECLEQECEELNKQVNDLLNKPEIQDKILWKIDNEALLGSKDAWIYKLKQTLVKIKEIAEKRNYLDYNECLDDILQKISECEVKYEN